MAQPKAKSNSIITSAWSEDGNILTMKVLGAGECVFDRTKATEGARAEAERNGWLQRLSDRAALGRDTATGLSAPPAAKLARIADYAKHIEAGGEWAMRAAARIVVAKGPNIGLILMALIRSGKAADIDGANRCLDRIAEKRGIGRDASAELWASTADVGRAMAEIAAERAGLDADALMNEMEEAPAEAPAEAPEDDEAPADAPAGDEAPF